MNWSYWLDLLAWAGAGALVGASLGHLINRIVGLWSK